MGPGKGPFPGRSLISMHFKEYKSKILFDYFLGMKIENATFGQMIEATIYILQ